MFKRTVHFLSIHNATLEGYMIIFTTANQTYLLSISLSKTLALRLLQRSYTASAF